MLSFLTKMNAICRISNSYPSVKRAIVPDDKVSWTVPFPEYSPVDFTEPHLLKASWADPDIADKNFQPNWNALDNGIDRRSYSQTDTIKYSVENGRPLNICGRTGLAGRGRLGRWGPNHAGDAIVTRWKYLDGKKELDKETGHPILQIIAILRKDCNKWAIPGGFVDPNEASSSAVLRELFEEALNLKKLSDQTQCKLKEFFKNGKQVYRGYVDDPRNTDNAWIETTAINFHDESGSYTGDLELDARDDAQDAKWVDLVANLNFYPPHYAIIEHLKRLHAI